MLKLAVPRGGIRVGQKLISEPALVNVNAHAPARILFITDLHLRRAHTEMADHTLAACRDSAPDLIALGGDLAEYDDGLELFLSKLRSVFPRTPAYSVPGNNDDALLGGDRNAQTLVYEKYGCEYLLNRTARIRLNGRDIELAGTEDAYTHMIPDQSLFSEDAQAYRLLLSHAPHAFLRAWQADLMLCGHTHGGQINILGFTCYFLPVYERSFAYAHIAGAKRFGRTLMLVSRGIGYSKLPLRIGARSEVHVIT
ncbi:MAG: metallophosphoesterase family protein [Clostridia bacterium]|nr:metallophosphoesterase family protein [Clostridia bacterium]